MSFPLVVMTTRSAPPSLTGLNGIPLSLSVPVSFCGRSSSSCNSPVQTSVTPFLPLGLFLPPTKWPSFLVTCADGAFFLVALDASGSCPLSNASTLIGTDNDSLLCVYSSVWLQLSWSSEKLEWFGKLERLNGSGDRPRGGTEVPQDECEEGVMQRCSGDRLQGGDGVPQVELEEDISPNRSGDCMRGRDDVTQAEGGK